jgi:ATP-dependent helicase/nuclease subunit B
LRLCIGGVGSLSQITGNEALHQALAAGATAVAGSRRLARALHEDHARWRGGRGEAVWQTPRILPWRAWIARELDAAGAPPMPPDEAMQALWERVIAEDALGGVDPVGLAALAEQAAGLMSAWRLAEAQIATQGGATAARFLAWRTQLLRALSAQGWTPAWDAEDALRAVLADTLSPVILCGIEELDRQQQDLVDAWGGRGEVLIWQPDTPASIELSRVAANDPEAELELALRWAAAVMDADPAAQVAVVIPDLDARHAVVVRMLDRILDPARLLPGEHGPAVYDVAGGTPLAEEPVVAAALNGLAALSAHADLDTLSRWLRSQHFDHDGAAAIATELSLRARERRTPAWGGLVYAAQHADTGFGEHCARIASARAAWPRRALPSRWASLFQTQLATMGWPGDAAAEGRIRRAQESWCETLARMAHLDTCIPGEGGREIGADAALAALRRLAVAKRFQIEAPGARLRVLGLLDLAGLRADALWVCGMSDDVWPRSADPNPLLPVAMQREAAIPHASPERELEFAERVTTGLLASAPRVIISWPKRRADEELRPSPLIRNLPEVDRESIVQAGAAPIAVGARQADAVEAWTDVPGAALPSGSTIRGGSGALQDQSRCPFRGYARSRLRAKALDGPTDGIPATARGTLAHRMLEAFWIEVDGSSGLEALDDAALERALERLAEPVYAAYANERPDLGAMLATERRLLVRRAASLIASERDRPAFTTASEKEESVAVGGCRLELKLDRVDRHADGRISIIDYKTGKQDDGKWFGERPDMPQLPLYAMTQGLAVRAVAFASLHARTTGFVGVAADGDLLPGVSAFSERNRRSKRDAEDFDGQMVHWREVLTVLGAELLAGRADPSPARGACTYCDLAAFCRIDEANARAEDEGHD